MDKATRERAIQIISDLTEVRMFSVITSVDVVDALTEAGILLVDSRTHWAAPNDPTKEILDSGQEAWEERNHGSPYDGEILSIYLAMRDTAKEHAGGGG